MPLPVWLIPLAIKGAAVASGAVGIGLTVSGAKKNKEANEIIEKAKIDHEKNINRLEEKHKKTCEIIEKIGKLELEIFRSFGEFSYIFDQIKNPPVFEGYNKNGIRFPVLDIESLKDISNSVNKSGFGTVIGSIFLGGIFTYLTGDKRLEQAEKLKEQVKISEKKTDEIYIYLGKLRKISAKYYNILLSVNKIFLENLQKFKNIVMYEGNYNWKFFSESDKVITENTILLVGLLYNMLKVEIVLNSDSLKEKMNIENKDILGNMVSVLLYYSASISFSDYEFSEINYVGVNKCIENTKQVVKDKFNCDI